jgi:hypothetical protein
MAVKTFTTGEVLTAADTNTYLANSGLVYVGGNTFTNTTAVDITGFTGTYSMYQVTFKVARHTGSGTNSLVGTVRSSTAAGTAYYGASLSANYLGTVAATNTKNNGTDFYLGDVLSNTYYNYVTFLTGGFGAVGANFQISGNYYNYPTTANITFGYESNDVTKNYERIRITCAVGISGRWQVYGFREP